MYRRAIPIILFLVFQTQILFTQNISITGIVKDKTGTGLFPVNIQLTGHRNIGAISDLEGNFKLELSTEFISDSLLFSIIGYKKEIVAVKDAGRKGFEIMLDEYTESLAEVVVKARSISEEFSVMQMKKLDIYLNPSSAADPLKALTALPVSTNMDETANPSLRGSKAYRSLVYFNGVPVNDPVRNSQLNGIGFFSLFNTEIIKNQNVYASNPPLIYGNASAGIIEIESNDEIEANEVQFSLSLANSGVFMTRKINDKSFIQLYGNYQFSNAFLAINHSTHEKVKKFTSADAGINFHTIITKRLSMNVFNYFINEASDVMIQMFTYHGNTLASRLRNFTIANLKYSDTKNIITLNLGSDFSRSEFNFGNINSKPIVNTSYSSLNFKKYISEKFSFQTGLTMDNKNSNLKDKYPTYYYAVSPESPYSESDTIFNVPVFEGYLYMKWKALPGLTFGGGVRKNFYTDHYNYFSSQLNAHYEINKHHSLLFAIGNYHSISTISPNAHSAELLSSRQIHFEYTFHSNNGFLQLAGYYKIENQGNILENNKIKGIEMYYEQDFLKYFHIAASNTILNNDEEIRQNFENNPSKITDFIKATLSWNHPTIVNASISYLFHQGSSYIPVLSAIYQPSVNEYEPVYDNSKNEKRLGNYRSVNLALNRLIPVKTNTLIVYFSIFNLFNRKNERGLEYNNSYSSFSYSYNQSRTIYFGMILQLHSALKKDK